jgi:serine/threonine protein kinase
VEYCLVEGRRDEGNCIGIKAHLPLLHENGVRHDDLRPGNVAIPERSKLHFIDLAHSRLHDCNSLKRVILIRANRTFIRFHVLISSRRSLNEEMRSTRPFLKADTRYLHGLWVDSKNTDVRVVGSGLPT